MIIQADTNVWNMIPMDKAGGTVILGGLGGRLVNDHFLHSVYEIGGKRLLGQAEINPTDFTDFSTIKEEYLEATGFGSRETVKRVFISALGKGMEKQAYPIAVAQMVIADKEDHWCPQCASVNLILQKRKIYFRQLPFVCGDCEIKFRLPDERRFPPLRIARLSKKIAQMSERYSESNFKKRPQSQVTVLAIVGESWPMRYYSNFYNYYCIHCQSQNLAFLDFNGQGFGLIYFRCKRCGRKFKVRDQEGAFLSSKLAKLKERYPTDVRYRRMLNRFIWWVSRVWEIWLE